jgi:hypothetical protein
MSSKAARILNAVAFSHALFYILKRQDDMCYQSDLWKRQFARMMMDMPQYLRHRATSGSLVILVKKKIIVLGRSRQGLTITLGSQGRRLARS